MKKISLILFCFIFYTGVFSQAVNIDFEASSPGTYSTSSALSGWTLSSQTASCNSSASWTPGSAEFSIVSTPILSFPIIGNILNSPLGGNNIARLNNSTANSSKTKLAQTFSVNSSNTLLQFAIAGVFEASNTHVCCEQTGFVVQFKNTTGTILSCSTVSFSASGSVCVNNSSGMTYTYSLSSAWSNWAVNYLDLTPYVNSAITIEVISTDCIYGDHFGTLFFDSKLGGQLIGSGLSFTTNIPNSAGVSFCAGSTTAQIQAPAGYVSYLWTAGWSGTVGTGPLLTITNPVANTIYTLIVQNSSGCFYTTVYALVNTSVSIAAIGSSSTCAGGASGSATIVPIGSGVGYLYNWVNSSNSIVGTSASISSLPSGNYSVTVTAAGSVSSSCGSASTSVAVSVAPSSVISLIKPYCSNEAYLGVNGGTNFQWYNGFSAITASAGGTQSSYTVTSPTNGSIYRLTYLSSQGCTDSVQYTLLASSPGSLSIISNPQICVGATNGIVILSMSPAAGSVPGQNTFSVFSVGTTSPAYSTSLSPSAINSFTATNLSAGGTYSVTAFDGSCKYSTSFSVSPYVLNFTLTPSNNPILCNGNSIAAGVTFTSPPSLTQYNYSWTPTTYLLGGIGNYQNTILTASSIPNGSQVIIYTVVVTPSLINCPISKTLSISFANPQTPSISAIPNLCSNGSNYNIQVSPIGGNFLNGNGNAINSSGILNPSLASTGVNTFTYANAIATCVAKATATFIVNAPPQISISGNTLICEGQSTSLLANGPASFTWNTIANGPVISISPSVTTIYTVTGFNSTSSCQNSLTITVNVLPLPQISISGDTLLCVGESITLSASGANSYSWNTGSSAQNITVSPTISTNYSVIGTTTNGNCSNAKVMSIVVSACTGIDKSDLGFSDLKIYPNPTNGNIFIVTETKVQMSIFDNLGKLVSQKELEKGIHSIDLSEYNRGVYLLKISNNSTQKVLKILKTND